MLKLQIVLIPPSALRQRSNRPPSQALNSFISSSPHIFGRDLGTSTPNANSSNGLPSNSSLIIDQSQSLRKFLHLTRKGKTLLEVAEEIIARFSKLYPDEGPLEILKLQDFQECDLDPDYIASEVFDFNNVVRVLLANEIKSYDSSNDANLSSPEINNNLKRRAPKSFSSITIPKKRAQEGNSNESIWKSEIDRRRSNTPLSNQIFPDDLEDEQSNQTTRNISINTENSADISLPPPDVNETRYIDPKKQKPSAAPSPLPPSSKRITSGMLVVPEPQLQEAAEATLHEQEINEKLALKLIPVKKHFDVTSDNLNDEKYSRDQIKSVSQFSESESELKSGSESESGSSSDSESEEGTASKVDTQLVNITAIPKPDSKITTASITKLSNDQSDEDDLPQEAEYRKEDIIKIFKNGRIPASVRKVLAKHASQKPSPKRNVRAAALAAAQKLSNPGGSLSKTLSSVPTSIHPNSEQESNKESPEAINDTANSLINDDENSTGDSSDTTSNESADDFGSSIDGQADQLKKTTAELEEYENGNPAEREEEHLSSSAAVSTSNKITSPSISETKSNTKSRTNIDTIPSSQAKPSSIKSTRGSPSKFEVYKLPLEIPLEDIPGLKEVHEKLSDSTVPVAEKESLLKERKRLIYNARRRNKRKERRLNASDSTNNSTILKDTTPQPVQTPAFIISEAQSLKTREIFEAAKKQLEDKRKKISEEAKAIESANSKLGKGKTPEYGLSKLKSSSRKSAKSEEVVNDSSDESDDSSTPGTNSRAATINGFSQSSPVNGNNEQNSSSGSESESEDEKSSGEDSNSDSESDGEESTKKRHKRIVNTPKSFSQPSTNAASLRRVIAANKILESDEVSSSQPETPSKVSDLDSKTETKNSTNNNKRKAGSRLSLSSLSDLASRGVPDVLDSLTPTSERVNSNLKYFTTKEDVASSSSDESDLQKDSNSDDSDDSDDSNDNSSSDEELKGSQKFLDARTAKSLLGGPGKKSRNSSAFSDLLKDAKKA